MNEINIPVVSNVDVPQVEEFRPFPKIARLSRECIITEKIDGTNGQFTIKDGQLISVGSRNKFLSSEKDNFGFYRWVTGNFNELTKLGDGTFYGEWWGLGIQRGYGLFERRFSLFRVPKGVELPKCVSVVPKLYEGLFDTERINGELGALQRDGSKAAPGYKNPEGIVIYHKAAGVMFKKTILGDEKPKGDTHE